MSQKSRERGRNENELHVQTLTDSVQPVCVCNVFRVNQRKMTVRGWQPPFGMSTEGGLPFTAI